MDIATSILSSCRSIKEVAVTWFPLPERFLPFSSCWNLTHNLEPNLAVTFSMIIPQRESMYGLSSSLKSTSPLVHVCCLSQPLVPGLIHSGQETSLTHSYILWVIIMFFMFVIVVVYAFPPIIWYHFLSHIFHLGIWVPRIMTMFPKLGVALWLGPSRSWFKSRNYIRKFWVVPLKRECTFL